MAILLKQLLNLEQKEYGFISFCLGVFLLFSAPAIAAIFFLISLIISFAINKIDIFKDKLSISLLIVIFLMFISCIGFKIFGNSLNYQYDVPDFTHPLVGLFNWIPLIFLFLGSQSYLRREEQRRKIGIILICGTIPVLFSGIAQYFFNIYGPFQFLNGLIIWYQREHHQGLTSLFNNQNLTGCILATVYPLFFASIFNKKNNSLYKFTSIFLNLILILELVFTTSRNSLLGLVLAFLILFIPFRRKWILFFGTSFTLVMFYFFYNNFLVNLNPNPYPVNLFEKFSYQNILSEPRIPIWKSSIEYILNKPFFGWGGNTFSSIWSQENSEYYAHSHSLPLEISIQYGVITTLLLTSIVIFILMKSYRKIFFQKANKLIKFSCDNHFDRAWFAATIVIIFSNLIDILYFDLRVSILIWILLAGLRNIINGKTFEN